MKYGNKLLQKLLELHNRILLSTQKNNNEYVIKFYQKFGFKIICDEFEYKDSVYHTSIIMGYFNKKT